MSAVQQSHAYPRIVPSTGDVRKEKSSFSAFTSHRLIISQPESDWYSQLEKRLNDLTGLPVGWDGYMGKPVSFQCANFAAHILVRLCRNNVPAPGLVPGTDGSLQIEWHRNKFDVEIDVLGAKNVIATRLNHETGMEEIVEIENDFSEIAKWVGGLVIQEENAR